MFCDELRVPKGKTNHTKRGSQELVLLNFTLRLPKVKTGHSTNVGSLRTPSAIKFYAESPKGYD